MVVLLQAFKDILLRSYAVIKKSSWMSKNTVLVAMSSTALNIIYGQQAEALHLNQSILQLPTQQAKASEHFEAKDLATVPGYRS